MDRRQYMAAVGGITLGSTSALSGCLSDDDSAATPSPTPDGESEGTPDQAETSDEGDAGTASVELTAFDSTDVEEAFTLLGLGTIENTGTAATTALLVGEIEFQDEESHTGRRLVTVPADTTVETRVKIRHSVTEFSFYDHRGELVSDPSVTQDDLRTPDEAHDLVVVDTEPDEAEGRVELTVAVENYAGEPRTATLEGWADFTGGAEYVDSRDISISGTGSEQYALTLDHDEGGVGTTYRYGAYVR